MKHMFYVFHLYDINYVVSSLITIRMGGLLQHLASSLFVHHLRFQPQTMTCPVGFASCPGIIIFSFGAP